jgi:hypothetical protein
MIVERFLLARGLQALEKDGDVEKLAPFCRAWEFKLNGKRI